MKENGQAHPIEILPDNTIVAGHGRVAAARLNGWPTVKAIVRKDLADAGDLAVERYLTTFRLIT